jgi:hypothetical protein
LRGAGRAFSFRCVALHSQRAHNASHGWWPPWRRSRGRDGHDPQITRTSIAREPPLDDQQRVHRSVMSEVRGDRRICPNSRGGVATRRFLPSAVTNTRAAQQARRAISSAVGIRRVYNRNQPAAPEFGTTRKVLHGRSTHGSVDRCRTPRRR